MIQSLINRYTLYPPTSRSLSSGLSEKQQQSLSHLQRAIAIAKGEYALIIARCENPRLRQEVMQYILNDPTLVLQEVTLHPRVVDLLGTLESVTQTYRSRPNSLDGLVVRGLESVVNIETLLEEANFVRDEFNKSLNFPVIFWVNDKTLRRMRRIAPDFSNYGATSICFEG